MKKNLLSPVWALPLLLVASACSEDTTSPRDAGTQQGSDGGGGGDGDGDGDNTGDGGNGQNQGPAKLGDNVAGKACTTNADCGGTNARCATSVGGIMGFAATPTPGGYCTGDCDSNDDCGAGGVCSALLGSGSCVAACSSNMDCTREGYHCSEGIEIPLLGQLPASCLPRPETDMLADGIVGKPCADDTACGTGFCADSIGEVTAFGQTLPGRDAPGGYCSGDCLEDNECGANGVCVALVPNQAGRCYLGCGNACTRDGYQCGQVFEVGGGGGGAGFGGGGFQNPSACVPAPAPEPDAGTPDSGTEEPDSGTEDAGPEPT